MKKAKIKQLQDDCKVMEEKITKKIKKWGGDPIKVGFGTFYLTNKKKYTFTKAVFDLEERVKSQKEYEIEGGIAEVEDNEVMTFRPDKYAPPPGAYRFNK